MIRFPSSTGTISTQRGVTDVYSTADRSLIPQTAWSRGTSAVQAGPAGLGSNRTPDLARFCRRSRTATRRHNGGTARVLLTLPGHSA